MLIVQIVYRCTLFGIRAPASGSITLRLIAPDILIHPTGFDGLGFYFLLYRRPSLISTLFPLKKRGA